MSSLAPPARLVVRAPSWLGDFVAAEPVLRALHGRWRAAGMADRLSIAAPAPLLALLADELAGAQRIEVTRGASADARPWGGQDVALFLDGSLRSIATAIRAGIPERLGWSSGGRALLLTRAIRPALERGRVPLGLGVRGAWPRRLPRPFTAACAELALALGVEVPDRRPRLRADPRALARATARLAARGVRAGEPFVLVNAGSRPDSAKGAEPSVLAEACAPLDAPLVVACASGEEASARELARRLPAGRAALLDDPPPDLLELAALIALARVVITPDSGPRHLARALGTPCVALCGPTDPRHSAEHGEREHVLRVELECSPCHRESCPLEGDAHRACMRGIPADRLRDAALMLVRQGARR